MSLAGTQLGRYQIARLLGSGGMGEVYLAQDPRIHQQVALKVIRSELTPYPHEQSAQEVARLFQREARAIGQLDHPHILPLYDYGETTLGEQTLVYLVMPYRPEGSLVSWIRQHYPDRLVPSALVVHVMRQAAQALQYAHDHAIIHQDVKPSNFLLRDRQEDPAHPDVLLADFGIARLATSTASASQNLRGTPTYMAPEQCVGQPVPASDQYALAVTAYELLTGRPPFQGNAVHLLFQHLQVPPAPPSTHHPHVPKELDDVLMTALSKRPEERFRSMKAFATAFQQAAQGMEIVDVSTIIRSAPVHVSTPVLPVTPDIGLASTVLSVSAPPITPPAADTVAAATEMTPATAATVAPAKATLPTVSVQTTPPDSLPGFAARTEPNLLGEQAAIRADVADEASAGTGAAIEEVTPVGSLPLTPLPAGPSAAGPLPVPQLTTPLRRKRGKGRIALLTAAALLALLLVFGGVASAVSRIHPASTTKGSNGAGSPTPASAWSATVTVIPASTQVTNTFAIDAVTGTPTSQQVQARQLSASTQTHSKTVTATGQGTTSGTNASGYVRIRDEVSSPFTVAAGTVYGCNNACPQPPQQNLHVVIDQTVTVYPNGQWLNAVPAHVQQVGTIGNMNCCGWSWNDIDVNIDMYGNMTGGVDPQPYTAVQQIDIDGAANSLISANQPDPQQLLQGQVQPNERLIGAQCRSNVSANQKAGDQASQVTVSVSFTCTGETYDYHGALALAAQLLTNQVASGPGAGYALVGQIQTSLTNATPGGGGTVSLTVSAEGVWAYQISASQQQAWAQLIAGKTVQEAQQLLAGQTGVAQVSIEVTGGDGQTLPTDPSKINFGVQTPPGS